MQSYDDSDTISSMNTQSVHGKLSRGFTIVELLIVIVVIAILAALSFVAYNGIQQRARDSQRQQDVRTIAKALELYFADNNAYPQSGCGASCPSPKKIHSSWATTSDGSWSVLEAQLVPKYISSLPKDPMASTATNAAISGGYNYDYVLLGSICGGTSTQKYALTYKLEGQAQKRDILGDCSTNPLADFGPSSEYILVK